MNKFREQLPDDLNSGFINPALSDVKKLVITASTNISGILDSENDIVLDGNFTDVLYSKKQFISPLAVL